MIDPNGYQVISKDDFISFMEKMVRGSLTEEPSLLSTIFSSDFYRMLEKKKCIKEETGDVLVNKLRRRMDAGEFDVEYFN